RYRRRATVVEAHQLTLDNAPELIEWTGGKSWSRPPMRALSGIAFPHPVADGNQVAEFGDWIVQLGDGNFRVWDDDAFSRSYEPVVERDPTAELIDLVERVLGESNLSADPKEGNVIIIADYSNYRALLAALAKWKERS